MTEYDFCMTAFGEKCQWMGTVVVSKGRYFFCKANKTDGKYTNIMRIPAQGPVKNIKAPEWCPGQRALRGDISGSDTYDATVIRHKMRQEYWKCGQIK